MPTVALAPQHNKLTHSWRLMTGSALASSHTGDLVETVLARAAFSPAAMGPNGIIQLVTLWSFTNNANSKIFRVRMGAAGITPPGSGENRVLEITGTTQQAYQTTHIIRNRNSQASQVCANPALAGTGSPTAVAWPLTIDTTAAFDLIFTGQLANAADTITLEAYAAELFYGA